jgi:hypothetical protein
LENPNVLPRYMKLNGLKNPSALQTLVSAMMQKSDENFSSGTTARSAGVARAFRSSMAAAARATEVMDRSETVLDTSDQNVASLLSDIRDELRRHNQRVDNQPIEAVARQII